MALNRKGSILDLVFIMVGIFTFTVIVILVSVITSSIDTRVQSMDMFNADAKSASTTMAGNYPTLMDKMIIFAYFILIIVSFVLAVFIPVHPIFLIFYIFEWIVLIFVGGGIANAYEALITVPALATQAAQYQYTTIFFRYYPLINGIVGAVLALITYKFMDK